MTFDLFHASNVRALTANTACQTPKKWICAGADVDAEG